MSQWLVELPARQPGALERWIAYVICSRSDKTGAMARYELTTEYFWTIELADQTVTTSLGKIGNDGHTRIKRHTSAAAAQRAYDALIAEKLEQGYVLAGKPAPKSKRKR